MLIYQMVTECDLTGETFDTPILGVGFVAEGATGRHCVVLHGGPEELLKRQENGETVLTPDEAREILDADPRPNVWGDF